MASNWLKHFRRLFCYLWIELDRKQALDILYWGCVRVSVNKGVRCSLNVMLYHNKPTNLTDFDETWQEASTQGSILILCSSGRSDDKIVIADWLRYFGFVLGNGWMDFCIKLDKCQEASTNPDSKWKLGQRWALSCNFRWANVGWRCKTISTLLIQKTLAQHVV